MTKNKLCLSVIILFSVANFVIAQSSNFSTSLHATRNGKPTWYNAENGGFETLTNVPIEELGCVECHGPADANGDPFPEDYAPSCVDCHKSDFSVEVDQCLSCHGRQKAEITVHGYSDVHRDSGMKCWDCHGTQDLHGDGTEYASMLEDGAIKADCEECHGEGTDKPLPASHAGSDPHNGKIHCTSCHAQSVISCYNCHFDSQVEAHNKRAKQQIKNFVLLVNRTKDNKIHPASFQSLTYQAEHTWVAFGPYTPHNITSEGRICADCHANYGGDVEAIKQYNETGIIKFATWNSEDSTLSNITGIVPMPEDYQEIFKIDFITYDGDVSDPVGPSKNWSYVEGDWDGHQMLYATPLTKDQMTKLGFTDPPPVGVKEIDGVLPNKYSLEQNYPNPFNPTTVIRYSIPENSFVEIKVYDLLGNAVETLISENLSAGTYEVNFDASELTSGIYFYNLITQNFTQTKKMILMK